MKKQTAVEWQSIMFKSLLMRLHFDYDVKFSEITDQIEAFEATAKEMEREENIRFAIQKLKPYTYWNEEFADYVKEDILRLEQELANSQTYGMDVEKKSFQEYPDGNTLNVDYWSASQRSAYIKGYSEAIEHNKEKIAMFICKYLGAEKHSQVYDKIMKDWEQFMQQCYEQTYGGEGDA